VRKGKSHIGLCGKDCASNDTSAVNKWQHLNSHID